MDDLGVPLFEETSIYVFVYFIYRISFMCIHLFTTPII